MTHSRQARTFFSNDALTASMFCRVRTVLTLSLFFLAVEPVSSKLFTHVFMAWADGTLLFRWIPNFLRNSRWAATYFRGIYYFSKIFGENVIFIKTGQDKDVLYTKIHAHLWYLAHFFLKWEMSRTQVVEKKHILTSIIFFPENVTFMR